MAVLPRGTCIRQGFVVTCVEFRPSIITCCLYSQMIHFAPLNLSVFEYLNISMSLDFFPLSLQPTPVVMLLGAKNPQVCTRHLTALEWPPLSSFSQPSQLVLAFFLLQFIPYLLTYQGSFNDHLLPSPLKIFSLPHWQTSFLHHLLNFSGIYHFLLVPQSFSITAPSCL